MAQDSGEGQSSGSAPSPLERLGRFVLGRPLPSREGRNREIGTLEGVPALGLDGISSSAYGPEAALSILAAAGTAGLAYFDSIMFVILALLGSALPFILGKQSKLIRAAVAPTRWPKENLGVNARMTRSRKPARLPHGKPNLDRKRCWRTTALICARRPAPSPRNPVPDNSSLCRHWHGAMRRRTPVCRLRRTLRPVRRSILSRKSKTSSGNGRRPDSFCTMSLMQGR